MIIFLKKETTLAEEKEFRKLLLEKHIEVVSLVRNNQSLLVVVGKFGDSAKKEVQKHVQVETILDITKPYKLASKNYKLESSKIRVNGCNIGDKEIVIMAGPCSVESKFQMETIAQEVKSSGCHILRGGAFKPRTGPYDFQGLGKIGLHFLKNAAKMHHLGVITEVLDVRAIELIEKYTDIFQVGSRNMQNYPLLKELGHCRKPVLLKRGMWATYKEFLLAAEYILVGGNDKVILCERGIRTHVPETRFTLDLNAVAYLKQETHLPIVVDPSHGVGRASLVRSMSKAAIAAGADGLLIEAHHDPRRSVSDADQAISTIELAKLVLEVKKVARAVGRS
ncbi:3-deoxy-7-phosphoheptulonate synthase [Candidatus Gottesmanbacteria bacterium RIFCSPHIGHO2_02_FULL_40_13]|uniref:3-deoxy-7-phosphoheptulonate synthase n=1 Tax=Candidatus Gottesmanbacteria bacterium RIFCSPHIGHO2_02_FULL_40_13 TaxID=1798384 RepID=A0A1F6A811_9BACT|nr:MAG: 3-deoxy-7-phosphoheptulonate synthase [Candidatus Gottesmanbacteria bacterium RIFCSPHIGHO2_02_FULL_40_13]